MGLDFIIYCVIMKICRYSSLVECQLPKLERRVRFPLSASFYFNSEFSSLIVMRFSCEGEVF